MEHGEYKILLIMQQFFQKIFLGKLKKYMKEECKSYLLMYNLLI